MQRGCLSALIGLTLLLTACGSGPKPIRGGSTGGGNAGPDAGGPGTKTPTIGDSVANDPLTKEGTDYFPAKSTELPGKRIFRLTQNQFDQTVKFILPSIKADSVSKYLALDPKQTNYDYSDFLTFNGANFTPYAKWVESITVAVASAPTSVMNCPLKPPVTSCHKEAASNFVNRAFRGAADTSTRASYTSFFETAFVNSGDLGLASAQLVESIMMSPSFTFRAEFTTNADGLIAPGEQRQNIAYTLSDSPLEQLIGDGIDRPLAGDPVEIAWNSKESKAKLERFFIDWLEIKTPAEMRISKEVFPEFTDALAQASIDETKAYLSFYLAQPTPKLSDIVRARKSFVTNATKPFYAKDEGKGAGADHDPKLRFGVFTQPSFIASRSGPIESNIIKRGVFFMRKVMCLETGLTPSGIDTTVSADLGHTERERIEAKTKIAPCSECHKVINPFGFAFENYDPLGRWRTEEHGYPINPDVPMAFLGEKSLVTKSPVEALDFFTKSDRFKQCFARQMFRYYMGRNETSSDDPTLKAMFTALERDDDVAQALKALVTTTRMNMRK